MTPSSRPTTIKAVANVVVASDHIVSGRSYTVTVGSTTATVTAGQATGGGMGGVHATRDTTIPVCRGAVSSQSNGIDHAVAVHVTVHVAVTDHAQGEHNSASLTLSMTMITHRPRHPNSRPPPVPSRAPPQSAR